MNFSSNRFLGEAIDHSHLDARKGYWQADSHFVGGPGATPLPAGEQQWARQAFPSRRAACHGKSRIRKFAAAAPYRSILHISQNASKDLHQAVIDNNLETLQQQLEPPVPSALVTAKDGNGLNVIHKAAGLGHTKILEYLIGLWPEGAHEIDITGKTPLHWAASAKNNMRCYTLLTQAGCDEEAMDYVSLQVEDN